MLIFLNKFGTLKKVLPYLTMMLIFSLMYLYPVFLYNEDIGLMLGVNIDDGSIAHAIMELFRNPVYNQHNGWHTRTYGWVFADISFFVILTIKTLGYIFGHFDSVFNTSYTPFMLLSIRSVVFFMGLISMLLFYQLALHLFQSQKIAFISALYFITTSIGSSYWYMVHPETTGMAFSLAAILYLVKYIDNPRYVYIFLGYSCLIFAALTKQSFSFIFIPVVYLFLFYYINYINSFSVLMDKIVSDFLKSVFLFPFLGIVILFLVHPYLLSEFQTFLAGQHYLTKIHQADLTFLQSFEHWSIVFQSNALILANIVLIIALVFLLISQSLLKTYLIIKTPIIVNNLFITSVMFCGLFLVLVIYGARTPFSHVVGYFYPILPLLILNLVAVAIFVWRRLSSVKLKLAYAMCLAIPLTNTMVSDSLQAISSVLEKMSFKNTTNYKSREYLSNNFIMGGRVMHDPSIPIPKSFTAFACNFWSCSLSDTAKPHYIIIQENYPHVNHDPIYAYIQKHQYTLIKNIEADSVLPQLKSASIFDRFEYLKELIRSIASKQLIGSNILIYSNISKR